MLDSIRKTKDNFIYTILILAVVAVMAFYGIGQMGDESKGSSGVAAWVNGELITQREFQQELEYKVTQYRSMMGGTFDEKLLDTFQVPQRTLEELVQYKLLAQQAKKLDFRVPDKELADNIRSIPYYQKNGVFDAETYRKLPNRGIEENRQRERLLLIRMQEYLTDRVRATPAEIKTAYALRETKVDLEYAKIDLDSLAAQQKPSSADVDAYLKSVPVAELKAYYDSHRKDFSEAARVSLRQIRVGIPFQSNAAQKEEARKKIDAIAKETNEKNFAEMARTKSDDEYAKKGGATGWLVRGTLEAPLETAIDGLEPGKVSAPIETSFGYYLVQVIEKKPAAEQPFEASKKKIAEAVLTEKMKKDYVEQKKAELEKLLADGKPIDAELKKLKVETKKTGPFSLGQGYLPNIGQSDSILDAVFDLTPASPVAKKLFYDQGHYFYVRLKSVERPKPGDFAKNEESVQRSVETTLQTSLVSAWLESLKKNSTVSTRLKFENAAAMLDE